MIDSGLSENEIHQVQNEIEKMEDSEDHQVGNFTIVHQSKKTPFTINAFQDSPEAIDLYGDTDPELAKQIQEEMSKHGEELEGGD